MTVRPQAHEVKQLVLRTFLDLGAVPRALFDVKETILRDRGRCLARAYRAGDFKAVWCLDDGTVKFYDAAGCLLRIVNLLAEVVPQLMAA